jgi:carboxymethylenebutenolidase
MGSNIRLSAADDHEFSAYVAECSTQPRSGLVLLQEIFGVNPHIRAIAIDCCGQGFTVMAPSLFGRVDRELGLGHGPAEVVEGMRVATKLALDGALKDVQAAITYGRLVCGPKSDSAGTLFSGTPG